MVAPNIKKDKLIQHISRFATINDEIYIGYFCGMEFISYVYTSKQRKEADEKFKQLKKQEEEQNVRLG